MKYLGTIGAIAAFTLGPLSGCGSPRNDLAPPEMGAAQTDEENARDPMLLQRLRTAAPAPNPPAKHFTPEVTGSAGHRGTVARDPLGGTEIHREGVALDQVAPAPVRPPRAGKRPPWMGADPGNTQSPLDGLGEPFSGDEFVAITPTASSPVSNVYDYPWASIVKLLMRYDVDGNDYYYVCTGFTSGSFHVVTAGHCIYSWDPNGDGDTGDARWADQVWVWAAQTDNNDPSGYPEWPYSEAHAVLLRSYTGWTASQNLEHDWGVVTLDRRLGDYTGWMGLNDETASSLNFSGYPAEAPYVPSDNLLQYHGYDTGNVIQYTSYRIEMDAYAYGGHSGCPAWYYDGSSRWAHGIASTSDRSGYAEFTYLTSGKRSDVISYMSDDENDRPPTARPDLIEYHFSDDAKDLLTNSVEQGGAIQVEFNALNIGHASTGEIEIDFYLSTNDLISDGDIHIGTVTQSGLDLATYINSTATLTVPDTVAAGDYYVGWITSCSEQEYGATSLYSAYHYYMDDRAAIHDETVAVTAEPTLDLEVTDVFAGDHEYASGDTIDLEWDESNNGNSDAGVHSFSVRLSTNTTISESDTEVCSGTVSGLGAGQSATLEVTCTVPQVSSGDYYAGVILDREGAIDETDEGNNTGYDPSMVTVSAQANCVPDAALSCPSTVDTWSNDGTGSTDTIDAYTCNGWDYSGPEYTYEFTAAADGEITVSLSGFSADLDLLLLEGESCDPDTCIADSAGGGTTPEELTFQAVAGTTYRIVVDGFAGATSSFDISLDCGADLIFEDDFEGGDVSAWDMAVTGGGDLQADPSAALEGGFGLLVTIDDTVPMFLMDDTPQGETTYHVRFWIDPNSLNMAHRDSHTILDAMDAPGTRQFRMMLEYRVRNGRGRYQIRLLVRDDGGSWQRGGGVTIPDAPAVIELEWMAASGPGNDDGLVGLYMDGVLRSSTGGLDNDQGSIDLVRLGPSAGVDPTTEGAYFIDEFVTHRDSYIGP